MNHEEEQIICPYCLKQIEVQHQIYGYTITVCQNMKCFRDVFIKWTISGAFQVKKMDDVTVEDYNKPQVSIQTDRNCCDPEIQSACTHFNPGLPKAECVKCHYYKPPVKIPWWQKIITMIQIIWQREVIDSSVSYE